GPAAPRAAADGGRRGADLPGRARGRCAGADPQRGPPAARGRHLLPRLGPLAVARGATGGARRLRHRLVGTPVRAIRSALVAVLIGSVVAGCGGGEVFYRADPGDVERVPATPRAIAAALLDHLEDEDVAAVGGVE